MKRSRARRTALVTLVSAAIHAVLLALLLIGVPWTPPAAPPAPTIEVTLERPSPPLAAAPRASRKVQPRSPRVARPQAPVVTAQPAPAPAVAVRTPPPGISASEAGDLANIRRALRASAGCANPDAADLSPAERAACRKQLHAFVGEVPALSGVPAEKRARFDQAIRCAEWRHQPIPPGHAPSNGAAGGMPGMGDLARVRDCPPLSQ